MAKKDTQREIIKFLKIRKVKSPSRAYEYDAGIDFFVPEFNAKFIKDLKEKNPLIFGKERCCNNGAITSLSGTGIAYSNSSIVMTDVASKSEVEYDLSDNNDTKIKFDDEKGENYFIIPPHSRIMIPAGIKSRMASPGRALIANNKSGIATKHGLVFGASVVDYTYKGEIHISVINTSTKNVRIYENMKIIQFLEMPVYTNPIEITNVWDEPEAEQTFYKGLQDDRGDGGFGSTDKNDIQKLNS